MSPVIVSMIVFACVFGGALLGMLLHAAVPHHHLNADSKDVVKLATGLVGTMAALVLGLLVASAKGSYDAQSTELTQQSSNLALLDRILSHYGQDTTEARAELRNVTRHILEGMWSEENASGAPVAPSTAGGESFYDKLQALSPKNDEERFLRAQALSIAVTLGQTRWLMYEQRTTTVSTPLLIVLVLWLAVIFVAFGFFAAPNATIVASLCVAALSVSAAVFLILEMYTPYAGVIQISSAPLRAALAHLGQ